MRKPRNFDAELEAINQKARTLRQRKVMQLGELVITCGADRLPVDVLAGALLAAVAAKDEVTLGAWQKAGAAMFQKKAAQAPGDGRAVSSDQTTDGASTSSSSRDGAT